MTFAFRSRVSILHEMKYEGVTPCCQLYLLRQPLIRLAVVTEPMIRKGFQSRIFMNRPATLHRKAQAIMENVPSRAGEKRVFMESLRKPLCGELNLVDWLACK